MSKALEGGPRTSFGNEVWSIVGRSRAPFWSEALAAMDSDGDGFSNGQELGTLMATALLRPALKSPIQEMQEVSLR